jgi:hypothetical protein
VLSQPGYRFHSNYDAGEIAANLVDSARDFRWAIGGNLPEDGKEVGQEYVEMVQDGVVAAQYVRSWQLQPEEAVLLVPAYTFLMNNRPVKIQFWLDIGSRGWFERLYQPLTHPYVLSRSWPPGTPWTDREELEANQQALYRLTLGLSTPLPGRDLSRIKRPERARLRAARAAAESHQPRAAQHREVPMFNPRPKQQEVLAYREGKMGVSAVPGSGKTQTYLTWQRRSSRGWAGRRAGSVDRHPGQLGGGKLPLADREYDREIGMLPNLGFRVRTLHGLAHDIVRERPSLVGLEGDFQIVDERAADQIRQEAAFAWLRSHPYRLDEYLEP